MKFKSGGSYGSKSFSIFSLTSSSLDLPPDPEASFGWISKSVLIISTDSLSLKVKSAFGWRPNIYGLSFPGIFARKSKSL